jgi:hypothetical protein
MRFLRSIGAALSLLAATNLALAQGAVPTPRYSTKAAGNNATYAATTEYTDRAIAALLASVNGTLAQKAPIDSPTFTGLVRVPAPPANSNDTTAASTAFVQATAQAIASSIAAAGYAPLNSPVFTGTPQVPDMTAGTATGQAANGKFVTNAIAAAVGTLGSAAVRTDAPQSFTLAQQGQGRQNIFAASAEDLRTLAIQLSKSTSFPTPLFGGVADGFKGPGGVELASLTGAFVDTLNGALIAGVGGPVNVVENASSLPVMTGNTATAIGATGYVASASSINAATQDAWKAFSGLASDVWIPANPTAMPAWVQLQVPVANRIAAYAVTGPGAGNAAYAPTAWQLRASNTGNGTDWVVLDTQSGQSPIYRTVYPIAAANQGSFRYYQLYVTAQGGGGLNVNELELLQYTAAFESHPSLPFHTSNTTVVGGATGYYAFGSSTQQTFDYWKAFDAATDLNPSYWASAASAWQNSYVGRITPTPIKIGGYTLAGYWDGSASYTPSAWQVQGSNTCTTAGLATDWVTLDSRAGVSFAAGERKTFNIPAANQGLYTCHRVIITAGFSVNSDISIFDLLQVLTGIEGQTSIPYHTGANTVVGGASGYAVTSTAALRGTGYEPFRAADGLRTSLPVDTVPTDWAVSGVAGWTRQLPAPVKVLAYRIASLQQYTPYAWQLRGSNTGNGADWVTLDSRTVAANFWSSDALGDWKYFVVQTPGFYTYYQLNVTTAGTDGYTRFMEVEYLQGTNGIMDVKSVPVTAVAPATKASIFALVKTNAGTLVPNTNLTAMVSRDNGVTWGTFSLMNVGVLGGYTVLEANNADLSALPAGTTMRYRFQSNDYTLGTQFGGVFFHWN